MEKKVLDTYERYLSRLEDRNADLGENYKAMREYINKKCTGRDRTALLNVLLYETIKAVKGHGIKHVSRAGDNWDKLAVQQLYMKLQNLQSAWDDLSSEREQRVALLADQFFKFVLSHKDKPWLQLYMYQCYSERDYGKWLKDPKYLSDDLDYVQALLDGKTPTPAHEDSETCEQDYEFGGAVASNQEERRQREQEYIDRFHVQCMNAQSSEEILASREDFNNSMKTLYQNFPDKKLTYMIPKCDAVMAYANTRQHELETAEMGEASQGT